MAAGLIVVDFGFGVYELVRQAHVRQRVLRELRDVDAVKLILLGEVLVFERVRLVAGELEVLVVEAVAVGDDDAAGRLLVDHQPGADRHRQHRPGVPGQRVLVAA